MSNLRGIDCWAFTYYARLRRVKEYVDQHLSEDLSPERVARIAGLEKRYFSTFFREKTEIRYGQWLATVRIHRAMEMMKTADYSITRLAFAVGFRNLRTFERAFKRRTGITPQAYKKSVRPPRRDRPNAGKFATADANCAPTVETSSTSRD